MMNPISRRSLLRAGLAFPAAVLLAACGAAANPSPTAVPAPSQAGTTASTPTQATTAAPTKAASPSPATSVPTPSTGAIPTVASTTSIASSASQPAAASSVPSCVLRPAQTEGPYFVEEKLNRSDIRVDPSDGS